ncbi:hypothetical protein SFRURICE_019059 [Spodoptera frugiperda]|nr:hypothetical protein SFRURICE_019059 [Spodoptera frugiperda]
MLIKSTDERSKSDEWFNGLDTICMFEDEVIVNGDWRSSRDSRRPECLWRSERHWDDVSSFCEAVMLANKEAGHVRERTSSSSSLRERHSGHRGSRKELWPP